MGRTQKEALGFVRRQSRMGKGGDEEEVTILACGCCCLVAGPFIMMIVVLSMSDSIAWNSYIARPDLLCDDFGFVPKPYYLELLILGVTQIILKIISSDVKELETGPNRLEVLYILFQVVTSWGSTISIFNAFPLHNEFPTTDGWYDYNMVIYMFSCSSACITGVQFLVNGFMIVFENKALGEKWQERWDKMTAKENGVECSPDTDSSSGTAAASGSGAAVEICNGEECSPDTDSSSGTAQASDSGAAVEMGEGGSEGTLEKKGRMCECYYSVKAFFKEPVECCNGLPLAIWFGVSGTFMLLPILPALVTHYFAMLWAYIWMFLPCFLAAFGIMYLLVEMMEDNVLENVPDCCGSFILVMVRCLLVFVALFIFQAPMEIGCFLYGYSLDAMPADGNEYTGAISQWWHTRDMAAYFDCVADRASDSAGAVFDVLSWF